MKRTLKFWNDNTRLIIGWLVAIGLLAWLLVHHLGSLVGGMSGSEIAAVTTPVGLHGIWAQPLYLPLEAVRSVVFFAFQDHGQLLSRLPNALFGALTIISFGWLILLWHNRRTAILTTALFATSAWTLHISRLASFDVLYLWAVTTLLLIQALLHKKAKKPFVWYGSLLTWGLLIYIPGMIWLVLAQIFLQRKYIYQNWKHFSKWWQRLASLLAATIWLPLLVIGLTRVGNLRLWLGLPAQFPGLTTLAKQFVAVPVHLFIRGPQYPELWLGRAPVLDVFTLVACLVGIYFYATKWKSMRSRSLGVMFAISLILVGLGGAVGLSIVVPLLYVGVATGIAYLLHDWLKVFPNNPLARGLGIAIIAVAVSLSCVYNLRAYFIAWPHNSITKATFRYHR